MAGELPGSRDEVLRDEHLDSASLLVADQEARGVAHSLQLTGGQDASLTKATELAIVENTWQNVVLGAAVNLANPHKWAKRAANIHPIPMEMAAIRKKWCHLWFHLEGLQRPLTPTSSGWSWQMSGRCYLLKRDRPFSQSLPASPIQPDASDLIRRQVFPQRAQLRAPQFSNLLPRVKLAVPITTIQSGAVITPSFGSGLSLAILVRAPNWARGRNNNQRKPAPQSSQRHYPNGTIALGSHPERPKFLTTQANRCF